MSNQEIRQIIDKNQAEIQAAFKEIIDSVGANLEPDRKASMGNEFQELNEFLEKLKTGFIYVALFGKPGAGKSSIAKSLIGADIATINSDEPMQQFTPYKKEPWNIVDVPVIMGAPVFEKIAFEEAKKAHGIIFVVSGEPFMSELELFELVHNAVPNTPKIVFVNKWDRMQDMLIKKDRELVCSKIREKMGKFVKNPDLDIIYGSARLYDREHDEMVRQDLPQLLNRMYEDTGRLGQMMNILDPDHRNESLNPNIRDRILAMIKNYQ